ncbi:hypothetical protein A2U01_0096459, partial [Trifolium medium]|nr:hypothetical protein [Trifolium medium]
FFVSGSVVGATRGGHSAMRRRVLAWAGFVSVRGASRG